MPVPAILAHSNALGVIALEDLGDVTLQAHLGAASPAEHKALYRKRSASSRRCSAAAPPWRRRTIRPTPIAFDVDKLTWELDFFLKNFLEGYRGITLTGAARDALRAEFASIVEELAAEPRVLCHRDYHSRNLMLHEGSLYIIDFQDARMGPDTYDLVSLLRDSYVDLTEDEVDDLIAFFLALRCGPGDQALAEDGEEFRRRFDLMALQRNLKALGTFGFQTISRGNPVYIQYIPRTLNYVRANLERYPRFARLRELLAAHRRGTATIEFVTERFGVSTHLFHEHRLTRDHLVHIAAHGFEAIELFATRSHFDYHDDRARVQLAEWLSDTRLELHSVHAPAFEALRHGDGSARSRTRRSDETRRRAAIAEAEAALALARHVPFRFLVTHIGVPAARRSAATIDATPRAAASRISSRWRRRSNVRVAIEVIPNPLSSADRLIRLIEDELDGLDVGICLDYGHAHLMGDLGEAIETLSGHLWTTHVHDNGGTRDDHLVPFAGTIDWDAAMMTTQKIGYDGVLHARSRRHRRSGRRAAAIGEGARAARKDVCHLLDTSTQDSQNTNSLTFRCRELRPLRTSCQKAACPACAGTG